MSNLNLYKSTISNSCSFIQSRLSQFWVNWVSPFRYSWCRRSGNMRVAVLVCRHFDMESWNTLLRLLCNAVIKMQTCSNSMWDGAAKNSRINQCSALWDTLDSRHTPSDKQEHNSMSVSDTQVVGKVFCLQWP